MRLSLIKLAGFKSFVDPTVLRLPDDLVGIVGPNGCGKSNLIDAVRWVLGESSARSLRGESMNDVIFNGSASRKPVSQASIELVFDNSQGRLGGPWASYTEIAVRRVLNRDGQSQYFLNGGRCRRRDIASIFLGTGLGPRSYAIIEQGTISRLIEARPEELRVFVEEAAGISRYQERRQETALRIQHTRDNLDRLNDVRQELAQRLQHLQRQARAAERYRALRATSHRLRAEALSLRWQALSIEMGEHERAMRQRETALEAALAAQRHQEAALEASRTRQLAASAALHQAQEQYYQAGAEISRLEQGLNHHRELRQRRADAWRQIEATQEQLDRQQAEDHTRWAALAAALAAAEPEQTQAVAAVEQAEAALRGAEAELRTAQTAWEVASQQRAEAQRQAELEQAHHTHGIRSLAQDQVRLTRLHQEAARLEAEMLQPTALADLAAAQQAATAQLAQAEQDLAAVDQALAGHRTVQRHTEQHAQAVRERLHTRRARLAGLRAVQETALGQQTDRVQSWLADRGLDHAPRLAECLDTTPGWEPAVEAALNGWLEAVRVPVLDTALIQAVAGLDQAGSGLTLFESPPADSDSDRAVSDRAVDPESLPEGLLLRAQVRAPESLPLEWLERVYAVADLDQALARRATLQPGDTVVTADGVWCGKHWLRLVRGPADGILEREREIRALEASLMDEAAALEQAEAELTDAQEQQRSLEQRHRVARQAVHESQRTQLSVQGRYQAAQAQMARTQARCAELKQESAELEARMSRQAEGLMQIAQRLDQAKMVLTALEQEQATRAAHRQPARAALEQCQQHHQAVSQAAARCTVAVETGRARLAAAEEAQARLRTQREQLAAQRQRWQAEAASDSATDPAAAEARLAEHLQQRVTLEAELQAAQQGLEACEAAVKAGQQAQSQAQGQVEVERNELAHQQLAVGEARIHQQHLDEQLRTLGAEPENLIAALAPEANAADWQVQLEQTEARIQRMGAVNLAAIEECAEAAERQRYLEAQNEDLLQALAALETAMSQMDRETRARFRQTFDQVNTHLHQLFPRLFGGGQARLELTGTDALDAGVTILVQPPGKRGGTLSLLSGGEKALTAIALVFAFFQLNPAPFCLLDEVDAPLDEANIGRFGELVREMATRVQLIFITHNRATMEIARYLAGVTMREPGVSRLVAVDVEAAARLAAQE